MSAPLKDRRQACRKTGPQSFEQALGLDCRLELGDPLRQLFDPALQVHFGTPISLRLRAFAGAAIEFVSRVFSSLARDCRRVPTPAGLVARSVPSDMGHRFFVSAQAFLSPLNSVAGNGDSNVRFWKLGTAFRDLRNSFKGSAARWWSHV